MFFGCGRFRLVSAVIPNDNNKKGEITMKKSKRIISMILAVIMLSMTAIGVNAEELIVGFDDLLEAVGIIEHDHEEEELMAMTVINTCGSGCDHENLKYDEIALTEEQSFCGVCGVMVPSHLFDVSCADCFVYIGKVRRTTCLHITP